MSFLEFIFKNFWHWSGAVVILLVFALIIKIFFNFIVELIHGNKITQNFNLPTDTKIDFTKNKENDGVNKVSSGATISNVDVSVRG